MSDADSELGGAEVPEDGAEAAAEQAPESAEAQLEAALQEVTDWKGRAQRSAADLANFRRRAVKEREDARKFGVENLLKDLLGVVDNLERAVGSAAEDDPVAQGVRMVLKQFTTEVGKHGAKPFDAQGEVFDPTVHEAMTQIETEAHEPGTIIEVYQRGWMLHERLARPAMVVVAAAPPRAEPDPPTDPVSEAPSSDLAAAMAEAEAAVDRVKAEREAGETPADAEPVESTDNENEG